MTVKFKRKLYTRGSSYETTIPIQLLFNLDMSKKQNVVFEYDNNIKKWCLSFEELKESDEQRKPSIIKKRKRS